jgi:hypothetical protein
MEKGGIICHGMTGRFHGQTRMRIEMTRTLTLRKPCSVTMLPMRVRVDP